MRLLLGGLVAATALTVAAPASANPWAACQPVARAVCTVLDHVAYVVCPRTTEC